MSRSRHALPDPLLHRVAEQFKALGEPSRLKLMQLLFDGELAVGELVAGSSLAQANVSKHLRVLLQAGWVSRRRRGLQVVYSLADRRAVELCALMCSRVQERAAAEAAATRTHRRA